MRPFTIFFVFPAFIFNPLRVAITNDNAGISLFKRRPAEDSKRPQTILVPPDTVISIGLTKVLADDLENNQVYSLVEFLRSTSKGNLARRGKRIDIAGLARKRVRFLVHKFLHTNHLSEYNFLARADTFEIVRIRPEPKSKEDERLEYRMPFVPIPHPPTAVEPRLVIEWQGKH